MRPAKALETKSYFLVYLVMALIALAGDWSANGQFFFGWSQGRFSWTLAIFFLCSFGLALYAMTAAWRSASELEKVLQQILTPFSYFQIFLLALTSAVIEEWFFRGTLQSRFGLLLTALIYGACHVVAVPQFWLWGVFSFVTGLALGMIYNHSQSLILVSFLHFGMNLVLLWKLNQQAHRSSASQSFR